MDEDWKQVWQPVVNVIGQKFGSLMTGADDVSAAAIRRYLEPLEFDRALHCDAEVAREHGFDDIVAPNTSVHTFLLPPMWQPGQSIFNSGERNAQPESALLAGIRAPQEPPTTGYFATDFEVEYFRPVTVGPVAPARRKADRLLPERNECGSWRLPHLGVRDSKPAR
jgi:hypothetical protein